MHYLDSRDRLVSAAEPLWVLSPKRIRAVFAGVTIVDSNTAYLFRGGGPPLYFFSKDEVRKDLIAATGRTATDSRGMTALLDIRVGDHIAKEAVTEYVDTTEGLEFLKGMVSIRWGEMDGWFEENEEVFVHARDPFKRIDIVRSDRHVEIVVGGAKIADTNRPVILIEPGHPIRYYLPKVDVRMDLLQPSETLSHCPYKGEAKYYSLQLAKDTTKDAAWCYEYPVQEASKIAGLLCFFNDRVDAIHVEG